MDSQAAGRFVDEIVSIEGKEKDGSSVVHETDQACSPSLSALVKRLAHSL